MAVTSQTTLVGEGPMAESSIAGEQCEIPPIDGPTLVISREEYSSVAGTSSPIR